MSQLWKYEYLLFSGDAAKLIGVHRSTVNRWLNSGKMDGRQMPNQSWLIHLDSINMKREDYGLCVLSQQDIDTYWKTGFIRVR